MGTIQRILVMVLLAAPSVYAQELPVADAGEPFGMLPLIDEVVVGQSEENHGFVESAPGVSEIQEILGEATRVLPNVGGARFFGYRLGAGKGLEAGSAYVLSVEYPEDAPRTVFVVNRGGEYARGFSTGSAVGDTIQGYTNSNPESVTYPLSGAIKTWKTLFFMHERFAAQELVLQAPTARPETPGDGFMVYIAQPGQWPYSDGRQAPLSLGAAVSRIRLFSVPNPDELSATINYPPGELPRRHLFWREEMSDGAVSQRNNQPAYTDELDWFEDKAKLMSFLGMNTFSKDLLEFGANQGWDSTLHGGNDWVHQSDSPQRWSNILEMLGRYDFYVLPMYEYCGSKGDNGLGYQTRARPLRRDPFVNGVPCTGYTHIWWAERCNVDAADPETLEDLRKIIDATIIRHKDRARFLGAWVRTRNSSIPLSFSDFSLDLFTQESGHPEPVTRRMLIDDEMLLEEYRAWWLAKRRALLAGVRDILHEELGPESVLLFTAYHEESGPGIAGGVATDDSDIWAASGVSHQPWSALASDSGYLDATLTPVGNWNENSCMEPEKKLYEWHHSSPRPDPANAKEMDGFLFTYPYNRLYSTSEPTGFEMFRGPAGVAMIRHYNLNENSMDIQTMDGRESILGYFVSDVDRAGPYSMLAEARALAYGDPRYIGYLSGQRYNRGFPKYVRNFNRAFLALPAVASALWPEASETDGVVVRAYPTTAHGTYLAVINTTMSSTENARLRLPEAGRLTDAVTGELLLDDAMEHTMALYPGEVRALVYQSSTPQPVEDAGAPVADAGASIDSRAPQTPAVDRGMSAPSRAADMLASSGDSSMSSSEGQESGGGCSAALVRPAPALWFIFFIGLFGTRRRCEPSP